MSRERGLGTGESRGWALHRIDRDFPSLRSPVKPVLRKHTQLGSTISLLGFTTILV